MKIRMGFVGNSSSSSFLIGLGKVIDVHKVSSRISPDPDSDVKLLGLDWGVFNNGGKLIDYPGYIDIAIKKTEAGARLEVESFNGACVSVEVTPKDSFVIYVDYMDGEDSDFAVYEDNGEYSHMDYNIDRSYFEGKEDAELAFDLLGDKTVVSESSVRYGAGRNG